jgi:hypothetical protein
MTQKHTYMAIITQKHHLFFKIIIIMEKLTKEQWLDLIHDKLKDVFNIAYDITEWRGQLWSTDQWLPQSISDSFVDECMKLLKLK